MVELGELEANHAPFEKRKLRVIAISQDALEDAKATQAQFPHLTIVSDPELNLARAVGTVHVGGHGGKDTNAPTTILLDGAGVVRWVWRPERFIERLSPQQLMAAAEEHLKP